MSPTPLSSWTGQLATDILLDTGILYVGSSIFSAQEGGLKYDEGKTIREIEFAGKRSAVATLDRTVMFKPKLTGTILELPATSLLSIEPGASSATVSGGPSGASQYQPKAAGVLYAAADYLSNVRAAWQRTDGTYFQVRFPKALCIKWDIAGTDKQEGKFAIEIEGRLDMTVSGAHVSDPPMVYEYFSVTP